MRKILDLGCGNQKHEVKDADVVGIDVDSESSADIIHNLDSFPWPFTSNEFDEIVCQDVLEHLQNLPSVMSEIHRISKPGCKIKIRTPHYSSYYAYNNPTHIHYFGYYAFDYFCRYGKFRTVKKRLLFPRILRILGLNTFFNRYPKRWEQLFAFIFRAENIYIELEVIKKSA
jgi:2-polyprenyl-3-methyl-5-hydroxy-6-metoxy-1,4-benzoquinol methylase